MSDPSTFTPLPSAEPVPPAPPRAATPASQRQSWREMPVRASVLITAGVLVVVLVVGARAIMQGVSDRRLLSEGTRVEARIDAMDGAIRNANRAVPRETHLSYAVPGDPPSAARREIVGFLSPLPGLVSVGDLIPIYIDPKDRNRWTDRVDPPGWGRALVVPLLLSPIVLALAAITFAQRNRVRRLYTNGAATTASVVEIHKSALAPGAKLIKVSPANGGGRLLTFVRPDSLGPPPARGEIVYVLVDDPTKPRRALLAAAYR